MTDTKAASDAIEVMVQQEFERRLAQKVWQRIFLFEDDKKELELALRSLAAKVLEEVAKKADVKAWAVFKKMEEGCTNTDGCDEHDHEAGESNALWAFAAELRKLKGE